MQKSFALQKLSASSTRKSVSASRRSVVRVEAHKVAVLGAAGGIGQPLSLLMKNNAHVTDLRVYDVMNMYGVAEDLSHINSAAKISAFQGDAELSGALKGAELVIIPAGVPRKPGMTRDDLFNVNAGIVAGLAEACATHCPNAVVAIISNPVNSTVPVAIEVYKRHNVANAEKKVIGVTTLDVLRANTFYSQAKGLDVKTVDVPVIGGHAGVTILPLFSQATPKAALSSGEDDALTKKVQDAGTVVVEKKEGKGSATLSMARAAEVCANAILKGLSGQSSGTTECAYVRTDMVAGVPFFATKVTFGKNGVETVHPIGDLNAFEKASFDKMLPQLKSEIEKGVAFAANYKKPVSA